MLYWPLTCWLLFLASIMSQQSSTLQNLLRNNYVAFSFCNKRKYIYFPQNTAIYLYYNTSNALIWTRLIPYTLQYYVLCFFNKQQCYLKKINIDYFDNIEHVHGVLNNANLLTSCLITTMTIMINSKHNYTFTYILQYLIDM